MIFRTRLLAACGTLAALLVLFVLGTLYSPERVQARTSSQPLLPGLSAQKIDGIEIFGEGASTRLRRTAHGWEIPRGTSAYPASADRIATFLRTVAGLRRTSRVSSAPQHFSELGFSGDRSRLLVLHQPGAPDVALQVGKRGPSGDADYVRLDGQDVVFLARGNLSFFLLQKPPYWYELHVLPDNVQGATISSITVSGALDAADAAGMALSGGYSLRRPSADKPDQWIVGGDARSADRVTAGAMASSLANLEAVDFDESRAGAGSSGTSGAGAGRLDITVATFEGKKYSLTVARGPKPGQFRITTDWSPWTYVVNNLPLRRAVLPESSLRGH